MSQKVLVTGAGGFVGLYLVKALLKEGHTVYTSTYSANPELAELLPTEQIIQGDLTDFAYTRACLETSRPEVIYHLAALSVTHTDPAAAKTTLTNNLVLQFNLLEAMRLTTPQAKLIAVCSGGVYGVVNEDELPIGESVTPRPLNAYAVSKLSQEYLALQYHYAYQLEVVILRPFNHTGPGQTDQFVVPALAKQFAQIKAGQKEPVIEVGNLTTARDFTDVQDMVEAYLLAAKHGQSGEIYNLGSGVSHSIGDILNELKILSGIEVVIKEDPTRVRGVDVPNLVADSRKFCELTGWQPTISFSQTLSDVLKYWQQQTERSSL